MTLVEVTATTARQAVLVDDVPTGTMMPRSIGVSNMKLVIHCMPLVDPELKSPVQSVDAR